MTEMRQDEIRIDIEDNTDLPFINGNQNLVVTIGKIAQQSLVGHLHIRLDIRF